MLMFFFKCKLIAACDFILKSEFTFRSALVYLGQPPRCFLFTKTGRKGSVALAIYNLTI